MDQTPIKVFTVTRAALLLGMSNENVRNLIRSGDLKPVAVTAGEKRVSWFFRPADVHELMALREAERKTRDAKKRQRARQEERRIPNAI